MDVNGNAYVGPNSQWAENKFDYANTTNKEEFYHPFSQLTDYYKTEDLIACNRVGLRPRLFNHHQSVDDFVIKEWPTKVIHLLGIESPGLTAAPALAEEVITILNS